MHTPSNKELIRQGCSRTFVPKYFSFKPNFDVLPDIKTELEYIINNPFDIVIDRVRTEKSVNIAVDRLYTVDEIKNKAEQDRELERRKMEYDLNSTDVVYPKEAFDFDLDISGGVYDISEMDACDRSRHYYGEWLRINRQLKDIDRLSPQDLDDEMQANRAK